MKVRVPSVIRKIPYQYYIVLLAVLGCITVVYAFTGLWPGKDNSYNTYAIQANAWLHGQLDVGADRPWLELAIYEGKYYASFPPFPSYLLLPFALIYGENTPDHWLALLITCIGVIYAAKLYRKVVSDTRSLVYYVLFLFLSTGYLFIGVTGLVWFFAQTICFTLSLMSVYYAVSGKGGRSLFLWACAVGCRPLSAIYLPLLLVILWKEWDAEHFAGTPAGASVGIFFRKVVWLIRQRWYWVIGPVVMGGSYMILNYARFGNIFEFGHNYLPEFMRTPTGQFDLSYLLPNLETLFRIPSIREDTGAFEFPLTNGFAFYLATPLFVVILGLWIYALYKKRKTERVYLILLPGLFIAHVVALCCHRTLGGWGFGNRYLLDTLPWLFFGMLRWKPESEKLDRWLVPVMVFGSSLNLVGTIAAYNYWI